MGGLTTFVQAPNSNHLCRGAFSSVYRAKNKFTDEEVAIKVVKKRDVEVCANAQRAVGVGPVCGVCARGCWHAGVGTWVWARGCGCGHAGVGARSIMGGLNGA